MLTMDNHLTSVITEIGNELSIKCPGCHCEYSRHLIGLVMITFSMNVKVYQNARLIFASMLFMEDLSTNIGRFKSKRDDLDALVCIMSSPEVTRLTKMGRLTCQNQLLVLYLFKAIQK